MGRKPFKNLVSFFLVLAVTVAVVAVLSSASGTGSVEEYLQQLHSQSAAAPALSAPVVGEEGISLFASLGGFLGLLLIAGILALGLLWARRSAQEESSLDRRGRRPRKEPALKRPGAGNYRV